MDPRSAKPIIGLIGGMGSGKSFIADALARRGGRIISGDKLGHEALGQPEIKDRLVARWGKDVLDANGAIDRKKVGRIVFADAGERRALEALVFPFIERRFLEEATRAQSESAVKFIVLDAAIMLEAGWNKVCDWLVYVHAPRAERLRRLAEQRGWSAKEVAARENAQMPLTDKVTRADFVVDNSDIRADLANQVESLLGLWKISP